MRLTIMPTGPGVNVDERSERVRLFQLRFSVLSSDFYAWNSSKNVSNFVRRLIFVVSRKLAVKLGK